MSDKPENPRAFPCEKPSQTPQGYMEQEGMTLRDYFAGQAILMDGLGIHGFPMIAEEPASEHMARAAYSLADAMLKERSK